LINRPKKTLIRTWDGRHVPSFGNDINLAGWFHLAYFGLVLPVFTVRGRKQLFAKAGLLPNRLRHFQKTACMLLLFTALSLLVARVQWIELFPRAFPSLGAVAAGLAMYAILVACARPRWRRAVERRAPVAHLFMPANAAEHGWWIAVSLLAGVGEEITWRGVQADLLYFLTGSLCIAALLSATSFGVLHVIQGWKTAAIIGVFSLGFHGLVWLAGSLYVAMAVHVAYDITAGITYSRLGRKLGYDSPPAKNDQAPQPVEVG
jgi:membrane protease YdiL (CAAX protease family)